MSNKLELIKDLEYSIHFIVKDNLYFKDWHSKHDKSKIYVLDFKDYLKSFSSNKVVNIKGTGERYMDCVKLYSAYEREESFTGLDEIIESIKEVYKEYLMDVFMYNRRYSDYCKQRGIYEEYVEINPYISESFVDYIRINLKNKKYLLKEVDLCEELKDGEDNYEVLLYHNISEISLLKFIKEYDTEKGCMKILDTFCKDLYKKDKFSNSIKEVDLLQGIRDLVSEDSEIKKRAFKSFMYYLACRRGIILKVLGGIQ